MTNLSHRKNEFFMLAPEWIKEYTTGVITRLFLSFVAPIAPVVDNLTDVAVAESVAGIYLWPVEQRNGPIR